ncbi:MAG: DMT family transporter [Clostridia bacterium]|nr:DMT family transporter [Clostridia bacterium]
MKKTLFGNLLLLFAAVIWGFAFVAQVIGVESGLGPVSFNAIRFGLGALVLLPVVLILERKKKGSENKRTLLIGSLVSGVMLFFAANLQQYALSVNANPGFAGFITALYTVWTPVAYFFIFKKKTAANVWVAVAVSILGFYLLCMTDGGGITFGIDVILLLISTLFWTAQILSVDHFVDKVSPLKLSVGQYTVCTLLSFAYAFLFERETLTVAAVMDAKWSILYCGILSVGVAYTLQVVGQRMTNPVFAVILMSTESVFSAIGGVLWNLIVPVALQVDQNISAIGYVGCAVIFAGVVLSQVDFIGIWRARKENRI